MLNSKMKMSDMVFRLFHAEWHGISVNKSLMSGPDLTNQIIGVLIKFRKEPGAVMVDIEAMFYQIFVAEKHS